MVLAISSTSLSNFGVHIRDAYRAHFTHELRAGTVKPLILPYAVLGAFILPVLYLSIPHTQRPWLYTARWPLMAFIVAFNLYETWTSSSANFAIGYAVGLMQAWGIVWSATLLVWMRPQFEAERVEKRRRRTVSTANGGPDSGHILHQVNGVHLDASNAPDEDVARSLREGYEYYWQSYPADAPWLTRLGWSLDLVLSFRGTGWNWCVPVLPRFAKPEKPQSEALVDLESIPVVTRQGYRRYRTRREWLRAQIVPLVGNYLMLDLLSVLMMKDPYFILGPESAAAAAAAATVRQQQPRSHFLHRSREAGISTTPAQTPFALPPILASLPPTVLALYHSLACFIAILVAINMIMTAWQLTTHFLVYPLAFGPVENARRDLWHYPNVNGSFVYNVLDKGIAGFWGGWWHQTFRVAFSAPSFWLARKGRIDLQRWTGKMVAGCIAFAQSGFLHAMGAVSCLPPSKPWLPPVFFMLCWVGTILQATLVSLLHCLHAHVHVHALLSLRPRSSSSSSSSSRTAADAAHPTSSKPAEVEFPTWLRRTGNFLFCFVYLNACQFYLCDDLARAGVWLLEPVPVSPLRALGMGRPGDSWWRWDPTLLPRWYYGGRERWWETGIAL